MAPAQGWHAKSWSVPHFLPRSLALDFVVCFPFSTSSGAGLNSRRSGNLRKLVWFVSIFNSLPCRTQLPSADAAKWVSESTETGLVRFLFSTHSGPGLNFRRPMLLNGSLDLRKLVWFAFRFQLTLVQDSTSVVSLRNLTVSLRKFT